MHLIIAARGDIHFLLKIVRKENTLVVKINLAQNQNNEFTSEILTYHKSSARLAC